MHASTDRFTRTRPERGPALYYGFCNETGGYRMMDLPEYVANAQQGLSRLMADAQSAYQDVARRLYGRSPAGGSGSAPRHRYSAGDCGCGGCRDCGQRDCHCECCVTDADVLIHARCGEVRRIPVTFANDSRRDRPVTLTLEPFVTAGGRQLPWSAQLSTTSFSLRPCDEQTVVITVAIRCQDLGGADQPKPGQTPGGHPGTVTPAGNAGNAGNTGATTVAGGTANTGNAGNAAIATPAAATTVVDRAGGVEACEVGYATIRADGCLVRPIVVAVAVLPDDCDAYQRPCSCGCCH